MRLIDADALYRKIKTECNPYGKPTINFEDGCKVLGMIDNSPTIEERKTGRWNEHTDYPGLAYLCSCCGYFTTDRSYYCPHCGARMEVKTMVEYTRKQAAIDAIEELIEARLDWRGDSRAERRGLDAALCAIVDLPSADVVEVVRCKDCKHRRLITWADGTEHWECIYDSEYDQSSNAEDDDWFCADGERGGGA